MIKTLVLLTATAATALALTACGSSGNSASDAAKQQLSAIQSAESQGGAASDPSSPDAADSQAADAFNDPGSAARPTTDVCSLLSKEDAISVVVADKLDPTATTATDWTFNAKAEDTYPVPACRFDVIDDNDEGTVLFLAQPGSAIDDYSGGGNTKVDGLGDEAYTIADGGTEVRVGNVTLVEGDDSFSSQITMDFLRKMAPKLT